MSLPAVSGWLAELAAFAAVIGLGNGFASPDFRDRHSKCGPNFKIVDVIYLLAADMRILGVAS